ncbi:50S ribosomal protein L3 [Candidatus Gottesmanbacteria bacterium]|nr:50S ribosomal protein L3 [Candidatus Gottesmanbacteria bacterium]
MISGILGIKLKQTQTFTDDGRRIPVTEIQAGPCWITRVTDAGQSRRIQLGFGTAKHLSKAEEGHIKKAGLTDKLRFLREIRVPAHPPAHTGGVLNSDSPPVCAVGDTITVGDVFQPGDAVRVTGTSKGKGFAGVVKRHHFAGGPRTHGQSDRERAPGSIGQTTTPGRVYRGKRMAGRMGSDQVTVRGLAVVSIDPEKNILTVKGVVPGGRRGLLLITKEG